MTANFSLEGKTAIVTGGSYGLGVTFASALADAGANIVVTARSLDRLNETKALIEAKGSNCVAVECDVREYEQVASLMKQANDRFGSIDVLVNNAGISDGSGIRSENQDPQGFVDLCQTDIFGLWYCCHASAQYMLR